MSELIGPALATALVLGVGPGFAFAIDAGTFLVSAAFLVRLRPRERGAPALRTTVLTELREGWAEVRSRTWVWVIIVSFSLALLPIGYVLAGPLGEALGAVEVLAAGSALALAALAASLPVKDVWRLRRVELV